MDNNINNAISKALSENKQAGELKNMLPEEWFVRCVDKTIGYFATSLSALLILVFALPKFFQLLKKGATEGQVLRTLTGDDGTIFLFLLIVFIGCFIGGILLHHSKRFGRRILEFLTVFWGMIALYEAVTNPHNIGTIIVNVLPFAMILGIIQLSYRLRYEWFVRMIAIFNLFVAGINSFVIARFFMYPQDVTGSRFVAYILLVFIAFILIETIGTVRTFFPAIFSKKRRFPS